MFPESAVSTGAAADATHGGGGAAAAAAAAASSPAHARPARDRGGEGRRRRQSSRPADAAQPPSAGRPSSSAAAVRDAAPGPSACTAGRELEEGEVDEEDDGNVEAACGHRAGAGAAIGARPTRGTGTAGGGARASGGSRNAPAAAPPGTTPNRSRDVSSASRRLEGGVGTGRHDDARERTAPARSSRPSADATRDVGDEGERAGADDAAILRALFEGGGVAGALSHDVVHGETVRHFVRACVRRRRPVTHSARPSGIIVRPGDGRS